uniref:Uncharacterized protein n=1 Tax=Cannabis sativa TaxID=3483 RepID=A0A803NT71_CANSA
MTAAEITDLFERLASHLNGSPSSGHEQALQLSISNFNLNPRSRVRVLDTALSLMCFKAPQVFDSTVKYLMETIVSVLSSSISCKVFQFHKDEVLLIGTSISRRDFPGLIEACSDVLQKLERHGTQYKDLLYSVLRVAISSSCYRFPYPSRPILSVKSLDVRATAVSKLLSTCPKGLSFDNSNIPFRLMSWFVDQLTLKNDILKILHESMERPFLFLCKEFHERIDWRDIVKCLVLSPAMFIETRALLHRWFLLTGLSSVLELLNALCLVMLDVISRPTWWDFSMDLGSKLPFANSFFPYHYHFFRILAGPISQVSLLHLDIGTSELMSCSSKQFVSNMKTPGMMAENIDHKSYWRIPLGILLGCLNYLDEEVCELLLHYAATDRIPQSRKIEISSLKNIKSNNEEILVRVDNYTKDEAISGASLVFSLTDIVESMSASLFETEDDGVDFICLVKIRVGKFLTKCINRLIQLKIEEDGKQLVMDLCARLKQWLHQGHRVLDINKYVDELIKVLSNNSSL